MSELALGVALASLLLIAAHPFRGRYRRALPWVWMASSALSLYGFALTGGALAYLTAWACLAVAVVGRARRA